MEDQEMREEYTSRSGYHGVLYGKSSMVVYDPEGDEVLHTGFRNINTKDELKEMIERMEEFLDIVDFFQDSELSEV